MSKMRRLTKKQISRMAIPERHQFRVAKRTLRYHPAIAGVMGGPSPREARCVIGSLREKYGQNPYYVKTVQRAIREGIGYPGMRKFGYVIQQVPPRVYEKEGEDIEGVGWWRYPGGPERIVQHTHGWYKRKADAIRRAGELNRSESKNPELLIIGNPPRSNRNDSEREMWVLNDEGLYLDMKRSRLPMRTYIRQNRAMIDSAIDSVLGRSPRRNPARGGSAMRIRRRRRSRNYWKGHRKAHRRAALKGWRRRSRKGRKSRKGYKKSGKKFIRMGGHKVSHKTLVKRYGVKGANRIWRKHKKIFG